MRKPAGLCHWPMQPALDVRLGVYAVFAHLAPERRAADAERLGCAALIPVAALERADQATLLFLLRRDIRGV